MQGWILFCIQIVLITISASGQIPATINSESGVNISWFGFWLIFSVINWHLCWKGWRSEGSTNLLLQTLAHGIWGLVALANVVISIVYDKYYVDFLVIGFVSVACVITYFIARTSYKVGLEDPIVRGIFSLLCRVIPQLTLCYYMLEAGTSGVSIHIIVTGHCTILIRIWNLRKNLSDRNTKASFIADVANEVSWIIATAIWIWLNVI